MGSRTNLLDENPDTSLVQNLSNETQVTADIPPTFLVHASNDPVVPVMNSIQFYLVLHKANVPAEIHVYADGPYRFGLAQQYPLFSRWPDLCKNWLEYGGIADKNSFSLD